MVIKFLLFTFLSAAVIGGSIYDVAVLPIPTGLRIGQMSGINDSGQVAGYGFYSGLLAQSFISTPASSALVPLANGWATEEAVAINDAGQVAGTGLNGALGNQAFLGNTSSSTGIPFPTGFSTAFGSSGNGINAMGEVAGTGSGGAFLGTTSGSTAVPPPLGWSGGAAAAVNDSGEMAGFATDGAAQSVFTGTTAGTVLYFVALNLPAAVAINDAGQVVGQGFSGTYQGPQGPVNASHAFIGIGSGVLIPLPAGANTAGVYYGSLNSLGDVVGSSDAGGWIWDPTDGTVLLNSLVPVGWNVSNGVSISDNGLILAVASFDGGPSEYVELSNATTPEPGTWLPGGVGLALIILARQRRANKPSLG